MLKNCQYGESLFKLVNREGQGYHQVQRVKVCAH